MKSERKQNFLTGAAILSLSTIVVKVIGMFYKIPLKRLIGDANYGYFSTAYEIYALLLTVSLTGLPVAMSRMISEAKALNNGQQVRRVFKTAMMTYFVLGLVSAGAMMLFSEQLATNVMNNPGASYSIFALGPAVFFISIASACRGFFQGQGNMVPTAISQIIEALCKLVLGLLFAWFVIRLLGVGPLVSGATILGITVGAALAALYLLIARRRAARSLDSLGGTPKSYGSTLKTLLAIAVPITIGAAGFQLINVVDSATIMSQMLSAAEKVEPDSAGVMARLMELAREQALSDNIAQDAADIAKGVYNYCQTIFNLPLAFIPNITAAIIPAITSHLTLKNNRGASMVQNSSLRIMGLIAMPCTIGMLVLAEPIIAILGGYEGELLSIAGVLLASLSLTILVTSISNMASAIMQAHGHVVIPVINTIVGGIMKVVFNYILVGNPDIAILGAPVGTFLCFFTIMVLNLFAMHRVLKDPPKLMKNIWRSGLAALCMGVVAYGTYALLSGFLSGWVLPCFGAIALAVVVYVILVVVFKAITYEDCLLLPKGEKIAKILKIR